MSTNNLPDWASNLEDEDWGFIKHFLLSSGSLKEVAAHYKVSYPTVRLRLDKLIQKIKLNDDIASEPFISLIKKLAINDKIDIDTTKLLINEYKKTIKGEQK